MNAQIIAARAAVAAVLLALLLVTVTTSRAFGQDGLVLVPEFQVLHSARGSQPTRVQLKTSAGELAGSQSSRQQRAMALVAERARHHELARQTLSDISMASPRSSRSDGVEPSAPTRHRCQPIDIVFGGSGPDQEYGSTGELIDYEYYQPSRDAEGGSAASIATGVSEQWASPPMDSLGIDIGLPAGGPLPPAMSDPSDQPINPACTGIDSPRPWGSLKYCFCATRLYYNPLYFEEINLERYGYGCCTCLQLPVSAAHFFGRVPLLPGMMVFECPGECNYALGHYRPGSCNPWRPVGCCRL